MKEYVILKLRLSEGLSQRDFKIKFKTTISDLFNEELKKLIGLKLITIENDYIKLTGKGKDFANIVWQEFV
ncbi:coproporphyrinogen III oxidase [compost metagenome]